MRLIGIMTCLLLQAMFSVPQMMAQSADSTYQVMSPAEQKQLEREKKALRKAELSRMKLQTYPRKWFVGGSLGGNFAVCDNITDHPPFRYMSDALRFSMDAHAGIYISNKMGFRAGLGWSDVANRIDNEVATAEWFPEYFGSNGYYKFSVFNGYVDALFDISGVSRSNKFYPLHVMGVVGMGVLFAGDKTLDATEQGRLLRPIRDKIEENKKVDEKKPFVGLSDEEKVYAEKANTIPYPGGGGTFLSFRIGLLFDYRVSKNVSVTLDLGADVTNDKFDGIDFDEPVDFLFRGLLGVNYYF